MCRSDELFSLTHLRENLLVISSLTASRWVVSRGLYELDAWLRDSNTTFTLGNCLFGSLKLTKNADTDKYGYSAYDTGFDA